MTPTDMPMADWLQSAWLARYLDRQLSGEELAWFEAYLLDKPELLAMVEVDNGLRDAFAIGPQQTLARSGQGETASDDAKPTTTSLPKQSDTRLLGKYRPPSWIALAASVVLGLGIGWLAKSALAPRDAANLFIASPTRIVFDTMRGELNAPRVEGNSKTARYLLIEIAVPANAKEITILADGNSRTPLQSSTDGFASFIVEREYLGGDMSLRLEYSIEGARKSRVLTIPQ